MIRVSVTPAPRTTDPFSLRHRCSSGTREMSTMASGRCRSKFSSTMTSVPPAMGSASGCRVLTSSASSSVRDRKTSTTAIPPHLFRPSTAVGPDGPCAEGYFKGMAPLKGLTSEMYGPATPQKRSGGDAAMSTRQTVTARMVGQSVPFRGAELQVTGKLKYHTDLHMPNMLHGKVVRSEIPHGRVRRIHTTKALQVPGVVAVLTAADVPNNVGGIILADWPILANDRVRQVGDAVALVAAEPLSAAQAAPGPWKWTSRCFPSSTRRTERWRRMRLAARGRESRGPDGVREGRCRGSTGEGRRRHRPGLRDAFPGARMSGARRRRGCLR